MKKIGGIIESLLRQKTKDISDSLAKIKFPKIDKKSELGSSGSDDGDDAAGDDDNE